MKKSVRFLSILLCLTLFVGAIPSTALDGIAETAFADEIANVAARKPTWEDVYAGAADPRDMYDPLDPDTVPEAIGYETAYARYHVERLYDEEPDLNTVVFLNADQTRTVYLFDYPVKYVDAAGTVRDIRLSVQSDASTFGAFQSSPNRMQTQFSRNLTDGIQLSDGTVSIQMIPMAARPSMNRYQAQAAPASLLAESKAKKLDERTVSYAYDEKTTFAYTPTYTGFKEDIVVQSYTGQIAYDFTLLTNGLAPLERYGSWYLADEDGEIRANIGDIIIFTADECNNTMGWLSFRAVEEKQEYVMTIHVDPDWLRDERTVYPIRIDPTIEISTGTGAIQDVTINSLQGSDGSSGSLFVGKRETYGISRTLMKFPGLNLSAVENASRIQSAVVEMRDVLCEGEELTVSCYVFTGNTWSESTAEWSNVNPNSYTTLMSEFNICYANGVKQATAHRYPFDITDAVQGWKAGNFDPNKGILFKANSLVENGSTYIKKTFSSYNRSSGKPSLTVTYTTSGAQTLSDDTYYLNNTDTGKYIRYASSSVSGTSGLLSSLGNSIRWEVRQVDGGYVIRSASDPTKYLSVSSNPSVSTVGVATVKESLIPDTCKWSITTGKNGGCLIKSVYNTQYLYSNGTGLYTTSTLGANTSAYNSRVWRCVSSSYYGNTSSYSARELSSSFSVSAMTINLGESKTPTIQKSPSNAFWATASDFTYTMTANNCIALDNVDHTIRALQTGTVTVTANHKVTGLSKSFTVKVLKKAIIIIPGIMGSELKTTSAHGIFSADERLWAPFDKYGSVEYNAKIIERVNALKYNAFGTPTCSTVDLYWGDQKEAYEAKSNFGTLGTYQTLNNRLDEEFGYTYEVKFFQYDWRKPNTVSAQALDTFINEKGYDSVVLVAHSMGGLVAANYLNIGTAQREKVETLVALGAPFFGSIDIVKYFQYCRDIRNVLNFATLVLSGVLPMASIATDYLNTATDVLYNLPSVYEMFPNRQYLSVAGQAYIWNANLLDMTITKVDSYDQMKSTLEKKLKGYSSTLMNAADAINDSLYKSGDYITNSVNSYYIVGTGIETTKSVTFDSSVGYTFYSTSSSVCGDGTVTTWSADLGGLYPARTFYAANRYHTGSKNKDGIIEDEGLVVSDNILTKVVNIIKGNPYSSVEGITQERPNYAKANASFYISNVCEDTKITDSNGVELFDSNSMTISSKDVDVIYRHDGQYDVVIYSNEEIYMITPERSVKIDSADCSCKVDAKQVLFMME